MASFGGQTPVNIVNVGNNALDSGGVPTTFTVYTCPSGRYCDLQIKRVANYVALRIVSGTSTATIASGSTYEIDISGSEFIRMGSGDILQAQKGSAGGSIDISFTALEYNNP